MTREQWKNRKFKEIKSPNHHYWEKTELTDKELWSSAFNAVASSIGCKESSIAIAWANKALKAWKEIEIENTTKENK